MEVRIKRKITTFRGLEIVQYIDNRGFFNGIHGAMFAQVWDNMDDALRYVRENLADYTLNGKCKIDFEVTF